MDIATRGRHTYFIYMSKFIFSELSCQHFNMSLFLEREREWERGRKEGRKKGGGRGRERERKKDGETEGERESLKAYK